MRRKKAVILIAIIMIFSFSVPVCADPGSEKKVYHNEEWDILLLYPDDWTYIEEFGDKIPVVMHPPFEEEPDGFVMFYFLGQGVFENMDDFTSQFEDEYLPTYESHEIISTEEVSTKEGNPAIDYEFTFVDKDKKTYVGNARLTIAPDDDCWMITYDRPPGGLESVEREALAIIDSTIFVAAEYLANEE